MTRDRERPLVVIGRVAALHQAEVGGARPYVDDQGVEQRIQAIGHGKGL